MQELWQAQGRPIARNKSAWVPLALLIVPAATFFLFFVLGFTQYGMLQGTATPAPQPATQPAWLHFCATHPKFLTKMLMIGLLCSGLNSLGTIIWLRKGAVQRGHYAGAFTTNAIWTGGSFLLVALATGAAYLYRTLCGLQILSSRGVLGTLLIDFVLPLGFLILSFGLMGLVAITSLYAIFEFFARLKRPAPES